MVHLQKLYLIIKQWVLKKRRQDYTGITYTETEVILLGIST